MDMPVFFFIDPDFVKDPQMKGIDTVTLSYTFFSERLRPRCLVTWAYGVECIGSEGLTKTAEARYDKNGNLRSVPGTQV